MTASLAKPMTQAWAHDLGVEALRQVLEASPLATVTTRACSYSKLKVTKMLSQDWSAQTAPRSTTTAPTRSSRLAAAGTAIGDPIEAKAVGNLFGTKGVDGRVDELLNPTETN